MSDPITNVEDAVAALGALPMPAGDEPKPLVLTEAQVVALAAAGNRVVNDEMHEHLCMCDAWPKACVSTGNYFMGAWDVDGLEAALPAVLGLWEQLRGGELQRLRDLVAELEAERHTTNEALADVTVALRGAQEPTDPSACQGCGSLPKQWCPDCAACEKGCFGGFDGNECTHANARWGGAR